MFKFKVVPDEGESYEVLSTTRDIKKWEAANKLNSLAKLQENLRITDLYKLAYNASVRQGLYEGTVAEFEDECDLELLADEGEADPFQKEA